MKMAVGAQWMDAGEEMHCIMDGVYTVARAPGCGTAIATPKTLVSVVYCVSQLANPIQ
jgi:hypothetical protein